MSMMSAPHHARGFTLLEVLITVVILAFGLLGLANLQAKLHVTEMEAYQRAQAVVLLQDFASRVRTNGTNAGGYVTGTGGTTPLGTGNTTDNCTAPATPIAQDRCDWQTALLGAAETVPDGPDAGSLPDPVGGMLGARGCVVQIQARNPAAGVCQPGIYEVSVAWQGLYETVAPDPDRACGINQFGNEALRRVISANVTVGTPECQ
jgi:type IV pilus assembly protein PilV